MLKLNKYKKQPNEMHFKDKSSYIYKIHIWPKCCKENQEESGFPFKNRIFYLFKGFFHFLTKEIHN